MNRFEYVHVNNVAIPTSSKGVEIQRAFQLFGTSGSYSRKGKIIFEILKFMGIPLTSSGDSCAEGEEYFRRTKTRINVRKTSKATIGP